MQKTHLEKLLEIDLKFTRKDFEELYFQKNQGNYFSNESTKMPFVYALIATLVFIYLLFSSIREKSDYAVTFFAGIFFLVTTQNFISKANSIRKRNLSIKKYLDKVEKIKKSKLELTENSFSLIQDNEYVIEKWANFTNIENKDDYIFLVSNKETYLIPKKSMTENEFSNLCSFIVKKVQ